MSVSWGCIKREEDRVPAKFPRDLFALGVRGESPVEAFLVFSCPPATVLAFFRPAPSFSWLLWEVGSEESSSREEQEEDPCAIERKRNCLERARRQEGERGFVNWVSSG